MAKDMTKDMTNGSPIKQILSFFFPLLLGNLFQQLYNLVDLIVVGKGISDKALAAVGATGSILFLIFGFIVGITGGLAIPMANEFGAKQYQRLRKVIAMAIYIISVITVVLYLLSLFYAKDLLILMRTPEDLFHSTFAYLRIILLAMGVTVFYNFTAFILRALGDSKTPLIAMIIASFINIILDIIFVIVLKLGVEGAAYATVIAQIFSAVFCFIKLSKIDFIRFKKGDFKYEPKLIKSLLVVGLPVGFMNSITAIGVMALQYFVNKMGSIYSATYSAGMKIVYLLEEPSVALGLSISTFSGQNYGAGKIDRIKKGLGQTLVFSLVMNAIFGMFFIFFPREIISIMLSERETIKLSTKLLPITGGSLWILGILLVVRPAIQGMRRTVVPMLSGILELFARVIVVIMLSQMGLVGVAIAEVSAWASAMIMLLIYFVIIVLKEEKLRLNSL